MPLKILIVEDNPSDVCLIEHLLEDAQTDYHFEVCTDLSSAIEALDTKSFDLILSDLSLPESRGAATIAKLREHNKTSPIIVISGDETEGVAEAGAQEFTLKNELRPDMLEMIITSVLESFAGAQA